MASTVFLPLTRPALVYSANLIIWITIITSPVKGDEKVYYVDDKYDYNNCQNKIENIPPTCSNDHWHIWSKEFFTDCRKKLQNYNIVLDPSPFEPTHACLVFPELANDENTVCVKTADYERYIVTGIIVLIFILILDAIGIAFIIYSILKGSCARNTAVAKSVPPPPLVGPVSVASAASTQPSTASAQQMPQPV